MPAEHMLPLQDGPARRNAALMNTPVHKWKPDESSNPSPRRSLALPPTDIATR